MLKFYKYLVISLLILFIPFSIYTEESPHPTCSAIKTRKCIVEGLIGNQPLQVCRDICTLTKEESIKQLKTSNRRLLYGPTGNGKTTLAKKYARLTNSEFHEYDAPSFVSRYQGSGAQKVQKIFEDAVIASETKNKRTVIFIDEIDALLTSEYADKTDRIDGYHKALEKLWCELDRHENNPRLFVIVATNHYDKLPAAFLRRFAGRAIELTNPNQETRKEFLLELLPQPEKFKKDIQEIIRKQKEQILSSQADESVKANIEQWNKELTEIFFDDSFQITPKNLHLIDSIIQKLKNGANELQTDTNALTDPIEINSSLSFQQFLLLWAEISRLMKAAFLAQENQHYAIKKFISITNGWSNAHLKQFITTAMERAELENNGILTKQILEEEYALVQKAIKSQPSNGQTWKKSQEVASFSRDVSSTLYNLYYLYKEITKK